MKTRQGYISNSSSSSFIISEETYESVFELAKIMIPCRECDDNAALIKKIEEAEIKGMDPNTSLCFSSYNYDTYIIKYKRYYLISTCNNCSWDDYIESLGYIPKDVKDLIPKGDNPWETLEEVIPKFGSFWYVEYDVGGIPISWEDPKYSKFQCSKHCEDIIQINGYDNPICVACYAKKKSKSLKLKKIKEFERLSFIEKISFVEDKMINIESLSNGDKKRIFEVLEEIKRYICTYGKNIKAKNN